MHASSYRKALDAGPFHVHRRAVRTVPRIRPIEIPLTPHHPTTTDLDICTYPNPNPNDLSAICTGRNRSAVRWSRWELTSTGWSQDLDRTPSPGPVRDPHAHHPWTLCDHYLAGPSWLRRDVAALRQHIRGRPAAQPARAVPRDSGRDSRGKQVGACGGAHCMASRVALNSQPAFAWVALPFSSAWFSASKRCCAMPTTHVSC